MAIGAVAAAHLGSTALGAAAGAVAGALAAVVIGVAFARLPRAGFAVASWIVSWLVAFTLQSIHWPLGGTEGIVVAGGPSPSEHYELGLLLTLLAVVVYLALARAPIGLQLAAAREREAAAEALQVPIVRLRIEALGVSGAFAGLAGALAVHLAGVGDPGSFSPFLSFKLFVVVLIGGPLSALGGLVGELVLGASVGGRRRDRLARTCRRRALAHAPRGDHAARRHLARLGRHRAAGDAQAPFRSRSEAPTEPPVGARGARASPSATETSPQPRTSISTSRLGGSSPSSARTAPGRRRCCECSQVG